MKIELRLPQQDVEAQVTCYGATGQELKVSKIVIEPIFYRADQRVPFLYGTSLVAAEEDGDKEKPKETEVQRFLLSLKGSNGKAELIDRSKQVAPQIEAKILKNKSDKPDTGSLPETAENQNVDLIDLPNSELAT